MIESDRLITATTPEGEAIGPTDVRVEFAAGTVFERAQAFDYTSVDGILKPIPFVPGRPAPPDGE